MKKYFAKLLVVALLVLPFFVAVKPSYAAINLCGTGGIDAPGCSGDVTLEQIVGGVMNTIFFVSFLIVLFFLVWGGLKWVLAQGEKDGISKARDQVTNSLIGLVVILASYLLLNLGLQLVLGVSLNNVNRINLKEAVSGKTSSTNGQ